MGAESSGGFDGFIREPGALMATLQGPMGGEPAFSPPSLCMYFYPSPHWGALPKTGGSCSPLGSSVFFGCRESAEKKEVHTSAQEKLAQILQ